MTENAVAPIAPDHDAPSFNARLAAVAALFVLLGATLFQVYRAGAGGEGRAKSFTYTQDEAYEQLVIGRELAQGVEKGAAHYQGATPLIGSASPGWSLTMGFFLGLPSLSSESGRSPDEVALVPLVINLFCAALLIALMGHLVSGVIRSAVWMFLFLLAASVFIPLAPLVMTGMEHVPHMVVILATMAVGLRSLDSEDASVGLTLLAGLLTVVSVSLRFESMAIAVGLLLWGWILRRTGRKLVSVLSGVAVVAAICIYLHAHGGWSVPSPVLLHAGMVFDGNWRHWPASVLEHAGRNLQNATFVWVLLAMAAALLALLINRRHARDPLERRRVGWLFVFVVAATAHLLLGQTEQGGFRHVAYLVPLGAVAVARAIGEVHGLERAGVIHLRESHAGRSEPPRETAPREAAPSWYRGRALMVLACVVPLGLTGMAEINAFARVPQAGRDAYVRNRLAASFVRTYFPSGPVATNETGLLGYETHARLVDLSGRTNHRVAMARYEGRYDSNRVASQVAEAGGPMAILFAGGRPVPVPREWKQIGGWHRAGANRYSDSAVTVYSVSPALENDVRIALRLFSEQPMDGIEFWFAEQATGGVKKES